MIEIYQAYGNYETMMDLTEQIVVERVESDRQQPDHSMGRCRRSD